MRNLKKVLSLTLALVMLIGMMVVGAGAATYTDTVDSDKQEAIEVTSAVEIIMGDGNGTFRPDGTLRRSEAAVIIARVLLTNSVVTKLGSTDCQFTDVTDDWAKAPIQYCANVGIINGRSATSFDPNANVTGVEFAKMLMCVLDDTKDYAASNNWKLDVRRDAMAAGLDTNGVPLTDAALSREDAAQMAFNAIQYSPSGSNGYVLMDGNQRVSTFKDVVFSSLNDALLAKLGSSGSGNWSIVPVTAEDSLAKTRFNLTSDTDTDAFGRTVKTWKVGKEVIYTASEADASTLVASYDSNMDTASGRKTITNALKGMTVDTLSVTETLDATHRGEGLVSRNGLDGDLGIVGDSVLDKIAKLTGNGVIVEIYASGSAVSKIVRIEKTLARVTSDPSTRTSNDTEQVRVPGVVGAWTAADKVHGWEDLAKDDVVLYVTANGETFIEMAESIEGVVSGRDSSGRLTVDGEKYAKSDLSGPSSYAYNANTFEDFANTYTFYLDNAGNIIGANKQTNLSTDYAYVLRSAWVSGSGLASSNYAEAELLYPDGVTEIVRVSSINGDTTVNGASGTPATGQVAHSDADNKWVTYSLDSDDNYELTTQTTSRLTSTSVTGNKIAFSDGFTASSSTVFLVKSGKTITQYVGFNALPASITVASAVADNSGVLKNTARVATHVYINATSVSGSSSDLVYFPKTDYEVVGNNSNRHFVMTAIVNGEEQEVELTSITNIVGGSGRIESGKLYAVATTTSDGYYSNLTEKIADGTSINVSDGVMTTSGSKSYQVDDDTVVYYIDTDGACTVMSPDAVTADATDEVYVTETEGTELARVVYIVEKINNTVNYTVQAKVGDTDKGSPVTVTSATGEKTVATSETVSASDGKLTIEVTPGAEQVVSITESEVTLVASTTDYTFHVTIYGEDGTVIVDNQAIKVTFSAVN